MASSSMKGSTTRATSQLVRNISTVTAVSSPSMKIRRTLPKLRNIRTTSTSWVARTMTCPVSASSW